MSSAMKSGILALFIGSTLFTTAVLLVLFYKQSGPLPAPTPSVRTGRLQQDTKQVSMVDTEHHRLSHLVVDGIEKVLVFIGYPHSGHSILAAMLDAHPNVVLATSYFLLKRWNEIKVRVKGSKYRLCNEIYHANLGESWERHTKKGYTLHIPSLWQHNFTELKIIGDKSAGGFAKSFGKNWPAMALKRFEEIEQMLCTPVVIHLVRNPYDMIATRAILDKENSSYMAANRWEHHSKLSLSQEYLMTNVEQYYKLSCGALTIGRDWDNRYRVLELHYADFVYNPKTILQRICDFLNIDCPQDYLETCESVAFKAVSKSRYLLDWPPKVVEAVNDMIKEFPFFSRYSFDSD